MGDAPATDGTITVSDGPAERRRALIGRTLGAFTVVEHIGGGGGGEVFRADQPELARSAVIKVMRAHARTSVKRVERFLREARLASRLDHPYAAHIYSFGAEPDDLLWIAMEHVRGVTLSELVERRGRVPLTVFAPFFERLCEVVRSAHELDIVHRDIKPSNVMVIERAGQLLPKLLDFGVAKGVILDGEDQAASGPGITEQGTIVGTPGYMAPEQWATPEAVDHRTDIYALGVLAYRCISGRDPFPGANRAEIAAAHQNLDPDPLGVGPPELDHAIRRALAKEPAARWTVATDFAAAVRKAVGANTPEPVPPLPATIRDMWLTGAPQPFAEALATLADASTTVEADNAVRDIVEVACRWLAALVLARVDAGTESLREHARSVLGHADAATWLALAKAGAADAPLLTGLADMFAKLEPLAELAERMSQARRSRNAGVLREDIALLGKALAVLTPLLEYRLVVGGERGPELWMGRRTTVRERVVVWWNEEISPGEAVLLDLTGKIALRLGPLVRAHRPLPHGDTELFVIASAGRGVARLAATPWGYELEDADAGKLLDRLHGHDTSSGHTGDDESPYPGLAPFTAGDATRYFGREHEVDTLANRLVRATRVAVLGPSGVGKSSFLHAGLAPRLAEHRVISMRPGRDPFAVLAAALECAAKADAIREQIRAVAARGTRGAVLIVDQLEELVTLADTDMRARFAELLGSLGELERVRVVVGLRDDFASMLESTDGLRAHFEPFVIGAPAASALRRILVEPARRAGFTFEDGVVDDVVREVEGRATALPLLGFTAARLWELRDHDLHLLTRSAYNEIGGVGGAIATYADKVYGSLGRREQAITRTLFGRLVAPDGTRVPLSRRDLGELGDGSGVVVERLVEARLLSIQETRDGSDEIVEPIHECLAERWPRLVRWRSEDAADRALIVDVRAAARRWEQSSRSGDQLWRGPLLDDLQRLVAGPMLLSAEREFARASLAADRRSRLRRRVALVVGAIAITATAAVFGYLSRVAEKAAAAADRRLTESLIAHGRRELGEGHNDPALAYFGEALRRGADSPALRLSIGLASMPWRYQHAVFRGNVDEVVYSDDFKWLVTGGPTGQLRWFKPDGTGLHERALGVPITWIGNSPAGNEWLVLVPGRLHIIDIAGNAPDRTLAVPTDIERARLGPGDDITILRPDAIEVLARDGSTRRRIPIAMGTQRARSSTDSVEWLFADAKLIYVNAVTGEQRELYAHPVSQITVSANRRIIVFLDVEGHVHVMAWPGTADTILDLPARADDVSVSLDGSRIGVIANRVMHVFTGDGAKLRAIPLGSTSWRAYTLDADDLWIGGEDGTLRHWHGERLVAAFTAHRASIDYVGKIGDRLLTSGADGSIILWDPSAALMAIGDEACPGPYAKRTSTSKYGIAFVECDQTQGVFVGVGGLRVPVEKPYEVGTAAASERGRVALARDNTIEVIDASGTKLASRELARVMAFVFTDEDTVIVATGNRLDRWQISTNQLTPLVENVTPAKLYTLAWAAPAVYAGDENGTLVRISGGKVTATTKFPRGINDVVPSKDAQYLALKIDDGANVVLRAADLSLVSTLPPGGDTDAPPAFDPSGTFLVRAGDTGVSIFDRTSGEMLVTLRELGGAVDDPLTDTDTVRVMIGGAPASFPLVTDRRPAAEILRDIECRVPLEVHGATLRDRPDVTCK